jgi:hypothetical protein
LFGYSGERKGMNMEKNMEKNGIEHGKEWN